MPPADVLLTIAGYPDPPPTESPGTRAGAMRCLADQGAYPVKLLLLALIVGAVLLMAYFGEPRRQEQADGAASPS